MSAQEGALRGAFGAYRRQFVLQRILLYLILTIMLIFLIFQRRFVEVLTITGSKVRAIRRKAE